MKTVLANDGIDAEGRRILEQAGFRVLDTKVPQEELSEFINAQGVDVLLVRSATQVRRPLIEACPSLRVIGRAGVGVDNIDTEFARSRHIQVLNTPGASAQSVAELVLAHIFTLARRLQQSNRQMPEKGPSEFNALKKRYSDGVELKGRTLGIIGFGRIGQTLATMAIGLGMRVLPHDPLVRSAVLELDLLHVPDKAFRIEFETVPLDWVLQQSDFISLHVPRQPGGQAVLGRAELLRMKPGAFVINTSRGGLVDELALLDALNQGHLGGAGLDVFDNEPSPLPELLRHPLISVSPHIGGSTREAQARIGVELAQRVLEVYPA
ncbi:MAG: D-2-hydroxyacid dehydrogenase [Flavobacteriales bacterium]|nr:D-2-hydroxyacid dehydrogenase [Flavobacteriales bacterium]MCX7649023.1 D-2-hydroxyacid dehydrogenase [Flavobacteriales bacterium]MDW8431090.1 D-2-hydroxyacid dehydrogenase [Flavobacteriales bacterium]